MQISGSKSLIPLRQPGHMKSESQEGQKLVFVYPILIDSSLQKYANSLRDFMAVDFIGQIKISNVNAIISDAVSFNMINKQNDVNPTQQILKSLNHVYDHPHQMSLDKNISIGNYVLDEYQNRIKHMIMFIKNQIIYDPRYSNLRPLISNITVQENLLEIPLIIGTKASTMNAKSLYWILLISILYGNLPLNKENSLDKILNIIENTDGDKLIYLLFDDEQRNQLEREVASGGFVGKIKRSDNNYIASKIKGYVKNEVAKCCFILKNLLNINKWNATTHNISTSSLSQESIPIIQSKTQKRHFDNAMGSFTSYVSIIISPILHSIESILGPIPNEIDFDNKVKVFIEKSTHSMNRYYRDFITHITLDLIDYTKQSQERIKEAEYKIDELRNMCHTMATKTLSIQKLINNLDRYIRIPIRFQTDDISLFLKTISETANTLNPHSIAIENFLLEFVKSDQQLENMFNVIKSNFRDTTQEFLYGNRPYSLYDPIAERMNDPINVNIFMNRYDNFYSYVCNRGDPHQCADYFVRIVDKLSHSISELLWFFFIWNFFSYIGEYIKDVEIDIEIQKKDVLDFPNYCMVLPLDIFKYLYTIYSSRNMHRLLKSPKPELDPVVGQLKYDHLVPNLQNINKMITIINDNLKVPNLMVIDQHKQTAYYQFMHMSKPNKISLSNLENYIKHQKNIISGF